MRSVRHATLFAALAALTSTLLACCASQPKPDDGREVWSFPSRSLKADVPVSILRPKARPANRSVMVIVVGNEAAFDQTVAALEKITRPYHPPFIVTSVAPPPDLQTATSKLYLDFIEWELIPRLESRLRHNGRRIIIGQGLGSDTAHAFALERPEVMNAHLGFSAAMPFAAQDWPADIERHKPSRAALNPSLSLIASPDETALQAAVEQAFLQYFPRPPSSPLARPSETR
ncbi:MAG: hypothetical protein AAF830_04385 [Pseudomonadota bacterium]